MSLFGLFDRGGRRTAPVPTTPPAAADTAPADFGARAQGQLARLADFSRAAGHDLDGEAYSRLRRIEDVLRPAIADAIQHPILPEREHAIEAMLTDLIPETLNAYRRIPREDRGSGAATSLTRQLGMLLDSAASIRELIQQDAHSALAANALLLEARLR
jgi:hypothetical protein